MNKYKTFSLLMYINYITIFVHYKLWSLHTSFVIMFVAINALFFIIFSAIEDA